MEIEMSIKAVLVVRDTQSTVILLQEETGERQIPIWVGPNEARAIGLQIENADPPRPLTHDLIREMLRELDTRVTKVVIHDIHHKTFLAHVHLQRKRERIAVDARPSDAIAIALRMRAPIYVEDRVVEVASRDIEEMGEGTSEPPADNEALAEWLESLDDKDLGGSQ